MNWSDYIRLGRLEVGLSRTELVRRVGVTFQQIQKYEKGANGSAPAGFNRSPMYFASQSRRYSSALRGPIIRANNLFRGLLAKPQALRLLLAFGQINDEAARLAVLHLVESIPQDAGWPSRKRNSG